MKFPKMDSPKMDKAKKLMNRKVLLGVSAIFVCIVLVAVCSFMPFIIDPTRWQTNEFLTDELITIAIVISSMVGAIFVGQASNAQDERSRISKARAEFFVSVKSVNENVNRFIQWVRKVLQFEDLESIKKRQLRAVGVTDLSVLDLEYSEIRSLLETPQKFNGRFYKGLSQEQIDTIIDIKGSKKKIKLVEPDYYLSVKNIIDNRTISERSTSESLKKSLYLTKSILGKVVITVVTSIIFASLMRDLTSEVDQAEAWVKFLSRLWSMTTSIFMGYLVGCQMNDIDAEYIEMRIEVHRKYLQDTEFVGLSEQEEAKQEFIERVKEEQVLKPNLLNEENNIEKNVPVLVKEEEE